MSDYIKRESIRDMYSCLDPNARVLVGQVQTDIDAIPPAEVYPKGSEEAELAYAEGFANGEEAERSRHIDRPKGEWIDTGKVYFGAKVYACSVCGEECDEMPTCMGKPMWKYCPYCGADMRGESDDV